MNIVVLVKQVPDTWSERKLRAEDSTLDRDAADAVINELDDYAIEEGLRLQEAHGGEVTIVSMGPEKAADAIRKALSMGADKAVHVTDEALRGSDGLVTSAVLANVLSRTGFDLVILGSESTDARMGTLAAMLAERLGVPQMSFASKVETDGSKISIHRQADYGYDTVEATLPAVVSVVEKINEPRYPSFKGIMAAKKKPVETLSAGRPRHGRRPGWPGRERHRGGQLRQPAAARGRHDRDRRRRRRRQGRRVPRGPQVHLSTPVPPADAEGCPEWLRSWYLPSTTARPSRRSPPSC